MRTAIVTDSTAYIPRHIREELDIHMIPLNVVFGTESYQEETEITADDFYVKVREQEELPKTSQPAIGKFVELFEELAKEYDAVISIHLSSGISGTYQTATTAGQMVQGIDVYTYDSEISCEVQGFYVREGVRMASEGKTPEEILARFDEMKQTIDAYFVVDDLHHLQRGGRLNSAQAFIGSLLQVKPVLYFRDKIIIPFEKIRTRKKALKRIVEIFDEQASKGVPMEAVIIHANREEEAKAWQQELQEEYPHVTIRISYFGAVIGTHLGEGSLGLGWYTK
ncbi:fatty acid-binding protein DegV [Bacillus pseudomycoides]|uniref:Fatty acid-binding protein DegV n=1 Tax=Bacillus pseudomycoides TaxID=64104 RepID=A0AA91V9T4_9BACI|nr:MULTISPECIES: DegV family protein [Bacillus]PEB52815.1 fatty acid-binding protein DegV [Bacillus sp. AFS098217]PED80555.1 fatty acid-binding protein DegV [Bacillus pseudomycoides]PEU10437.1 fatty acid-binding protein DegV [Bacillus sp. AFS019443]PEU18631.1 fatty acid-binding protein DegV [Bacillus sp. AFS014408]PFW65418.1 fatty acid-binding protein DegV [Bacillus sp. AFS075034]